MLLSLIPAARGEWKERYAQNDPAVNQWYKDAQMNEATGERLGKPSWKGCCEKGDVFKTQFRVGGDNSDQWWYLAKDGSGGKRTAAVLCTFLNHSLKCL
jgi:hypothetical protein